MLAEGHLLLRGLRGSGVPHPAHQLPGLRPGATADSGSVGPQTEQVRLLLCRTAAARRDRCGHLAGAHLGPGRDGHQPRHCHLLLSLRHLQLIAGWCSSMTDSAFNFLQASSQTADNAFNSQSVGVRQNKLTAG